MFIPFGQDRRSVAEFARRLEREVGTKIGTKIGSERPPERFGDNRESGERLPLHLLSQVVYTLEGV